MSNQSLTEQILAMAMARSFYLDGRSKSEIADEFRISRFRVARILDRALRDGLVRIELAEPVIEADYTLSTLLRLRFGLRNVIVVDDHGGEIDRILDNMGCVAAALLDEISRPNEVLGFAWTRVMEAMIHHLSPLKARAVVQLGGAWPGAGDQRTSVDLVRDMAQLSNGRAYVFYAPLAATDPSAAKAIQRQPDVMAAHEMFGRVTLAVVGLGAWRPGGSSLWEVVPEAVRDKMLSDGIVAEICGKTMDINGRPMPSPLSRMAVGMPLDIMARCEEVLALAFGADKSDAILAAIRGGIVKSLITHAAVAHKMLATLKDDPR